MRNPENMVPYEVLNNEATTIRLQELPVCSKEDYDFFDDKDLKRFFTRLEKVVIRNSYEYKALIKYLKEDFDMTRCSYYENVNNIDTRRIKIHIHHEPLTLFDICQIVFNKRMALREPMDEEDLGKEVLYLHYILCVGLIPLAETVHELVHNQYLFVPTHNVFGNYKAFVDSYRPYFNPEQLETLAKIETASTLVNEDYKVLLDKNYIYIEESGVHRLPKIERVLQILKERVADINYNSNILPN